MTSTREDINGGKSDPKDDYKMRFKAVDQNVYYKEGTWSDTI